MHVCMYYKLTYVCSWNIRGGGGRSQRWQTIQKFNFMELNCSRCLFASLGVCRATDLLVSFCPGTNQICQSHEPSRMKMKLFLICVIRIKNQFTSHTHKATVRCVCRVCVCVCRERTTTPYAGENKVAARWCLRHGAAYGMHI